MGAARAPRPCCAPLRHSPRARRRPAAQILLDASEHLALILQVGLWEAFLYELALIIFFLIYNAVYAWCFDRVFGLPDSAQ